MSSAQNPDAVIARDGDAAAAARLQAVEPCGRAVAAQRGDCLPADLAGSGIPGQHAPGVRWGKLERLLLLGGGVADGMIDQGANGTAIIPAVGKAHGNRLRPSHTLARARRSQQRLKAQAVVDPFDDVGDRLRLIAFGFKGGVHRERHVQVYCAEQQVGVR